MNLFVSVSLPEFKSIKVLLLSLLLLALLFEGQELKAQNFKNQLMEGRNMAFFGVGPSMFYGDNGGDYPSMKFPVSPNITAGYTRGMLPFMSVRMTTGWQRMVSWDGFSDPIKAGFTERGQAASFTGSALYLDIMPQFMLFTQENLGNRPKFNMYGGLGLGTLFVSRNQQVFNPEGPDQSSRVSTLAIYVPLRAGASYAIGELYNISLESTLLKTFADDLDGNRGYNNRNDHLFQLNVVLQRYF
ncbi:hypothetical protein EF405_19995 [Cyclobacteriaceae bacterium YHN15]|nr:hypothetical protein EF405_19995 [Cyclobacteriaceae bacterium YHN15]